MPLLLLILIIVGICVGLYYASMPYPLRIILIITVVILSVVLLIICLQMLGVLPPMTGAPARIR